VSTHITVLARRRRASENNPPAPESETPAALL